jgi:hypothetical protein
MGGKVLSSRAQTMESFYHGPEIRFGELKALQNALHHEGDVKPSM